MKKLWAKKSKSFKSLQKFEKEYYLSMSPLGRLEAMQFLRETAFKLKNEKGRKGLRRVIRIVK